MSANHRSQARYRPTFQSHRKPAQTVVTNEDLYCDGKPQLGKQFKAARTKERQEAVVELLKRAAKRATRAKNPQLRQQYRALARKLSQCKPKKRCGSLACPPCARAYQKALVVAQRKFWKALCEQRPGEQLVFVTIIPKEMTFSPGQFSVISVRKANRWLKDNLRRCGTTTPITGSVDFEWDKRRGGRYLQVHWHLTLLTNDPKALAKQLKKQFPRNKPHERVVKVEVATDRKFLPYLHKIIKFAGPAAKRPKGPAGDPVDVGYIRAPGSTGVDGCSAECSVWRAWNGGSCEDSEMRASYRDYERKQRVSI